MQHQWVQKIDITHLTSDFEEGLVRYHFCDLVVEVIVCAAIVSFWNKIWPDAFRMVVHVERNEWYRIGTDHRTAAIAWDVSPKWHHKQALLRRIQKMDEEIAINVPGIDVSRPDVLSGAFWLSDIDDEPTICSTVRRVSC